MRSAFIFFSFTVLSILAAFQRPSAPTTAFDIHRGINISHWLSQSQKRGVEREEYMQAVDFRKIAEMGFDHVRIPIDEEQMWDTLGNKNEEAFRLLHNAIGWSFENGLRVIVDLHILRSHHFNAEDKRLWTDSLAQLQFWGFWEQLSQELMQYPDDMLAYELLNEAVADNAEDWNHLIAEGIKTVRKKEPTRKIVVGSNRWQQVYTFPELRVPENDTNLILSFHFYEPFIITHYKTPWNPMRGYTGPVNYPGWSVDTTTYATIDQETLDFIRSQNEFYSKEVMEKKIRIAADVAKQHGLPLYCGEFGCYPTAPVEIRQAVYRDLITVLDKYNIAWAHWNYKNDFPLVDQKTLQPIKELTSILLPENP
ncbi:MAG: cellulase family glycosylhydrolase [bacterium]